MKIRALLEQDLNTADQVIQAAFGTQGSRLPDLTFFRNSQPDGFFCAEVDGEFAGMVGAVKYQHFASIGMMVVHPRFQRHGLGRALMEHVLGWLEDTGCPNCLLDASAKGAPLYEQLGFVDIDWTNLYQPVDEISPVDPNLPVEQLSVMNLDEICALDLPIFGTDRRTLLRRYLTDLPGRVWGVRGADGSLSGYLVAQSVRLGPWVALDEVSGRALLGAVQSLNFLQPPAVLVPDANRMAANVLEACGYQVLRSQRHMHRGPWLTGYQRNLYWGEASFALG